MGFIQSHRMFYRFREKYPDIVRSKIPGSFESYRDPEKFIFFFRKNNKQFLENDFEIWRLRQQTKYLLIIGLGLVLATLLVVSVITLIK